MPQVGLVDDLGDDLHARVRDFEALDDRLERARVAVMAEIGAQHVTSRRDRRSA